MNRHTKYSILLFALLNFLFLASSARQETLESVIDSLKQRLIQYPERDTAYAKTLLWLAAKVNYTDPTEARGYAEEGLKVSKQLFDRKLEAQAYNILGTTHFPQNLYAESIPIFRIALNIAEEINYTLLIGELNNHLGIAYRGIGSYPESLKHYLRAEQIYDSLEYSVGLARVSNNLGNLLKKNGQHKDAEAKYKQALIEYTKLKHGQGRASAQLNLGTLYSDNHKYDSAAVYLDSALHYYTTHEVAIRRVMVLNSLGSLYLNKEENEKATNYLNEAFIDAKRLALRDLMCSILINLSRVEVVKGDIAAAEAYGHQAQAVADEMEGFHMKVRMEHMWTWIYQEAENWKEAYKHLELLRQWEDSLAKEQTVALYKAQEVQQEVYKQEAQLKVQEQELTFLEERLKLENRWKWTLAIASILFLFSGGLYYQKFRNRKLLASKLEVQNQLITNQKTALEAIDEAKTKFFTNISHEFRTPLNLILGPLRTHQHDIPRVELDMMQRNAERLLRLINQMLDLSKLEVGQLHLKYQNVDLFPYLRGLASTFSPQAAIKQITYQIDIPSHQQLIQLDPEKLEQIIYNLLSNAFKFTPQGGKVSFFAALNEEYVLQLAISDTGLGVPVDLKDKIFDRFYQVDGSSTRPFEGTGIGLALTKELVDLHGGSISLESEVQKGCRFILSLPLKPYEPGEDILGQYGQRPNPIEQIVPPPLASRLSKQDVEKPIVLVVEDHPDLRQYLVSQLKDEYHCLEANDGEEGLLMATQKVPDIIITDIMMPRMDGVELTQKLKTNAETSHVPIIMLTAKNDPRTRREGFEMGADQYLAKPFDPAEIRARLQSVLMQQNRIRDKYSKAVYLRPKEVEIEDREAQFLKEILKVVETQLDNSEFTVTQLQEEVGMSRMQLHRKLKALTGKTTSEFIRYIRLQRAAELLQHPGAQVADVAYSVGFGHLSYFAKCFKEQFGQVPSSYLKEALD